MIGTENSGKTLLSRNVKDWIQHNALSKHAILDNVAGPTIGVDITDLDIPYPQIMSNANNIIPITFKLRELGSAISSKWHTYYEEATGIIFTIDASDVGTWSNSAVLFHECLLYFTSSSSPSYSSSSVFPSSERDCPKLYPQRSSKQENNSNKPPSGRTELKSSGRKRLLLILTKVDLTDSLSLHVLQDMLRLDEILEKSLMGSDPTFPVIEVQAGSSFDEQLVQSIVKWMQDTLNSCGGN